MTRGLTRQQLGVTDAMIATYGEIIFLLSNNLQTRRGDPIRQKDFQRIEQNRHELGMSDRQIAELSARPVKFFAYYQHADIASIDRAPFQERADFVVTWLEHSCHYWPKGHWRYVWWSVVKHDPTSTGRTALFPRVCRTKF